MGGVRIAAVGFQLRRKVKKPTSGKNKKNMDTFADSRGDAQRRSRKARVRVQQAPARRYLRHRESIGVASLT